MTGRGPAAEPAQMRLAPRRLFMLGLAIALVIAGGLSLYASQSPDGLEKVAADKGMSRAEKEHALKDSPLGDYGVEGIGDPRLSGGLAGVAGVLLTLTLGGGLFWAVRRPAPEAAARAGGSGNASAAGSSPDAPEAPDAPGGDAVGAAPDRDG